MQQSQGSEGRVRRGRKPVPSDRRKQARVSIALSAAEYDRVCLTALRLRMGVSRFVRLMLIGDDDLPISVVNQKQL